MERVQLISYTTHKGAYFMFVACDGYRVLYAAGEILLTDSGNGMFILEEMNGRRPPGWYMLACTADYYADCGLWGKSHILKFRLSRDGSLL